MKNGKVYQFIKNNWRVLLYGIAFFAGIFCGIWSCQKHSTVSVDAYRPRVIFQQSKTK